METFEQKRTNWMGLWYDEKTRNYKSQAIKLSDLREFKGNVRIIAMKNRYFEKDSNKPNMVFMIADSNATAPDIHVEDILKGYIKTETAIEIALQGIRDSIYGFSYDDLSVEIPRFMYANSEGEE